MPVLGSVSPTVVLFVIIYLFLFLLIESHLICILYTCDIHRFIHIKKD